MSVPPRHRSRRVAAGVGALLIALLSGCAATGSDTDSSAGEATDGGTLRIAFSYTRGCIDPNQTSFLEDRIVGSWLVDSLTSQDPDTGEILPWLATEWDVSDDAKSFTFSLRDDVTFSDGTAFDAESVKTAFDAINALGAEASLAARYLTGYQGTTVVDDQTVRIDFDSPNAPFLQGTSQPALGILSPASYDNSPEDRCTGDFVGSGLYTLDQFSSDAGATFTRRDGYAWGPDWVENDGEAHIESVELTYVPEYSVITGNLTSDQIDVAWPRNALTAENQAQITSAGGSILSRELPGLVSLAVPNVSDGHPLSDSRVREALSKGIDREEAAETLFYDDYPTPSGPLSSTTPGFSGDDDAYAYDPDGAKELLEEAGYALGDDGYYEKDGERLTIDWVVFTDIEDETAATLFQDQLKDVGIELNIVPTESTNSAATIESGDWDTVGSALTGADADILRSQFDTATVASSSAAYYSQSPETATELTKLFADERGDVDVTSRNETFAEIQSVFTEETVAIPTTARVQTVAYSSSVHGLAYSSENYTVLNDAWIDAN